jgi:thymidine phosphorylase
VLDVKVGNGAFLPEESRALELARTMIEVGRDHDCEVVALVTAMDRPLGRAVGNALEVVEAVEALRGGGPPDLREVTLALASEMLVLGGAADSLEAGRETAAAALDDGRALDVFRRLIAAQDGDPAFLDAPDRLPTAAVQRPVEADRSGRVVAMDTRAIGEAAVDLGAGRRALGDAIDPAVGFMLGVKPGDSVAAGDGLGTVHAVDGAAADAAAEALRAAVRIGEGEVQARRLISHRVTAAGVESLE